MFTAQSIEALSSTPSARVILAAFHRSLHRSALQRCPADGFFGLDGDLNSSKERAVEAVIKLFHKADSRVQELLKEGKTVELDFGLEFNFGFTGGNYTSIPFIIAHFQQNPLYLFVRNDEESKEALKNGKVPVKFFLAGSGGDTKYNTDYTRDSKGSVVPISANDLVHVSIDAKQNDLSAALVNLNIEPIDPEKKVPLIIPATAEEATNAFGYNRLDALKFAASLRPSSVKSKKGLSPSPKTPSSSITSPQSASSSYNNFPGSPSPTSGPLSPTQLGSPQSDSSSVTSPNSGTEQPKRPPGLDLSEIELLTIEEDTSIKKSSQKK